MTNTDDTEENVDTEATQAVRQAITELDIPITPEKYMAWRSTHATDLPTAEEIKSRLGAVAGYERSNPSMSIPIPIWIIETDTGEII